MQVVKHLLFHNGSLSLMFPCPLLLSKLVTGSHVMGTSIMKESRCYSSIIHRTSILTYCKASFAFFVFFFLLAFLSRIFTFHRTAHEGRGYLLIFFLPIPPASITLISRVIAAESSPLRTAASRSRTESL